MIIPTGMRYSSRLEAREWKTVSCEHCPADYAYEVKREGHGSGRSVLFLDNDGARSRAASEAEQDLERQLERAVEAVWCPGCGKYQSEMHRVVRNQAGCLFYLLGGALVVVGVVVSMFWGDTSFFENLFGGPGLLFGGIALAIALGGFIRSLYIDPDAGAAERVGRVATFVPVMTRLEYEVAREAAIADGVSKRDLLRLRWPRDADAPPLKKRKKRKKRKKPPEDVVADAHSDAGDEAARVDPEETDGPPAVRCGRPICEADFELPSSIAETSWPVRCPSCHSQLAPEDWQPPSGESGNEVRAFIGPLLIERDGRFEPLRIGASEGAPSSEASLAD